MPMNHEGGPRLGSSKGSRGQPVCYAGGYRPGLEGSNVILDISQKGSV